MMRSQKNNHPPPPKKNKCHLCKAKSKVYGLSLKSVIEEGSGYLNIGKFALLAVVLSLCYINSNIGFKHLQLFKQFQNC